MTKSVRIFGFAELQSTWVQGAWEIRIRQHALDPVVHASGCADDLGARKAICDGAAVKKERSVIEKDVAWIKRRATIAALDESVPQRVIEVLRRSIL